VLNRTSVVFGPSNHIPWVN